MHLDAEIVYMAAGDEPVALQIMHYPDGAPLITNPTPPRKVLLRPRTMSTFYDAMFWFDSLRERGHAMPELILPCVPGARQDRLNPTGDVLFTLKSVAALLNARHFPRVTILDPHSLVTPALIAHCQVIATPELVTHSQKWAAVIAPDGGAVARASAIAQREGIPLLHGWKKRNVKDGTLSGFGMQPIPDDLPEGPLLVVDDLCDGGGTFIGLAQESYLERQHRPLHLYVTHGLFTSGTKKLFAYFNEIFCTDSVIADRPGVHVSFICDKLLRAGE